MSLKKRTLIVQYVFNNAIKRTQLNQYLPADIQNHVLTMQEIDMLLWRVFVDEYLSDPEKAKLLSVNSLSLYIDEWLASTKVFTLPSNHEEIIMIAEQFGFVRDTPTKIQRYCEITFKSDMVALFHAKFLPFTAQV